MDTVVRVLLADDNARFRGVLRRLLERDPDIVVVAEADDGARAVDLAAEVAPDVVLMDVSMPAWMGSRPPMRQEAPSGGHRADALRGDKEHEIAAGLAGGASAYLVKGGPAGEIVEAIKRFGPVAGSA